MKILKSKITKILNSDENSIAVLLTSYRLKIYMNNLSFNCWNSKESIILSVCFYRTFVNYLLVKGHFNNTWTCIKVNKAKHKSNTTLVKTKVANFKFKINYSFLAKTEEYLFLHPVINLKMHVCTCYVFKCIQNISLTTSTLNNWGILDNFVQIGDKIYRQYCLCYR